MSADAYLLMRGTLRHNQYVGSTSAKRKPPCCSACADEGAFGTELPDQVLINSWETAGEGDFVLKRRADSQYQASASTHHWYPPYRAVQTASHAVLPGKLVLFGWHNSAALSIGVRSCRWCYNPGSAVLKPCEMMPRHLPGQLIPPACRKPRNVTPAFLTPRCSCASAATCQSD
jgi:hypothetical protein